MTSLPEIVAYMSNRTSYSEPTNKVETVQTQMSIVFLTDKYVYKIKKPVNLGYLDYTTLEKRKYFCEREVELNRRLCTDTYLGVIPLTLDDGKVTIDGKSQPIEYMVKMRRLPQNRMLDVLLTKGRVSATMMGRVAVKVADFHNKAETRPEIGKFGNLETIEFNTEENFSQTSKYIGRGLTPGQYEGLVEYTRNFIKARADVFNKRVADGKIKDCHGDLHAQHICFTDPICIYDCIEFNDRFRYVDVAAEVSFLAMDLDHWGRPDLSTHFVNEYVVKTADRELLSLLNFYKCYFAYVRGKVNCFRLDDILLNEKEKAKALADAKNYFGLAESYRMRDER
jgi:aminoglycoside phosphotransferase family enzyme